MEQLEYTPFTSLDDLYEVLMDKAIDNTVVLHDPGYCSAVVGISDEGRVIYSYELMVRGLCEYAEMTREEAMEYIDYNTVRALPYMGPNHPIILYNL